MHPVGYMSSMAVPSAKVTLVPLLVFDILVRVIVVTFLPMEHQTCVSRRMMRTSPPRNLRSTCAQRHSGPLVPPRWSSSNAGDSTVASTPQTKRGTANNTGTRRWCIPYVLQTGLDRVMNSVCDGSKRPFRCLRMPNRAEGLRHPM